MLNRIITCFVLTLVATGAAISRHICSIKTFDNQRGEFVSQNYPSKSTTKILCRLRFNTSLLGNLKVYDSGFNISKLRLDIWYMRSKWLFYTVIPKDEIIHLPKSTAYDMHFHSPKIWFSFYENNQREPSNKVWKPCDKNTTANCGHFVSKGNADGNNPDLQGLNKCPHNSTKPSQPNCLRNAPKQTAKNSAIILISSLIGGLFLIIALIIGVIWKRHQISKHGTVQRRQTHPYSQPDMSSIYVSPNAIVNCQLPQENEESHIYEKITTSIYYDPQAALKTVDSNDKLMSGFYCEPQTTMKTINSSDKLSGLYCEPQTVMKNINSNDKLTSGLYWEPQTLKDVDKENSTPIYVNIL
ncbi:uncharacterized protein LOC115211843 isoform X2 [Octopus sinensis]|uniref:Uncharacterized protein LOC115211843 isoform X2 n=1 Tax=Octopus sinensis TaxID=2607531 RepID=A0A7E6EUI6_9MOLL|nr:uncharacterized protein LOC115211843 isoform X2 [Octopus sinensis]